MGGYSIAFDLVSTEYGWTDDVILDLTVRRFRQIVAAIRRRQYLRRREEISLVSWQARQFTSYIAAGYMIDGKKGNPALDAAQVLAYDEIEAAQIEEAQKRAVKGGLVYKDADAPADAPDVVEVVAQLPVNLPSQESVFNAFGDPSKWRARG